MLSARRLAIVLACGALAFFAPYRLSFVVASGPMFEFTDWRTFADIARSGTCLRGSGPKFYFDMREIEFVCES